MSVSLQGEAQGVFKNLSHTTLKYKKLVLALKERFSPKNQTKLYRAQLQNKRQKSSKTLSQMGQDIKKLTNLAYPSAPTKVKKALAKKQFINSLASSNIKLRVKLAKPTNLNNAIRHAVKLKAFNTAKRKN